MRYRMLIVCALLGLLAARPASADVTGFIGTTLTSPTQQARGLAVSVGVILVAVEFEYADVPEDTAQHLAGLRTGMVNALVQPPLPLHGIQLYGTAGAGLYHETLGSETQTDLGVNIGGGAKVSLMGPVGLRLDYRVFTLRGSPAHSTFQRIYAGLNLKF
jgi:hypothetical protein